MVTKVSSDKTSNPPAARALRSDDAPERVLIFDTTLRDGEQAVGATMTTNEKLDLARVLSRLGVDALEVGFPAASHLQLDTVRAVTERVGVYPVQGRPATSPPIICALARTLKSDIDVAWQAIQDAFHPRIHTFIGTSEIHRTHKLNLTPEAVIEQARAAVGWLPGGLGAVRCEDHQQRLHPRRPDCTHGGPRRRALVRPDRGRRRSRIWRGAECL